MIPSGTDAADVAFWSKVNESFPSCEAEFQEFEFQTPPLL